MKKSHFNQFLKFFPEIELPIVLDDEIHHTFSTENETLPLAAVSEILLQQTNENEAVVAIEDEFTEFVPCFKMPDTGDIHALVYWRAELLNYNYFLITFDKIGNKIDKKIIGGMTVKGNEVRQRVASIDEDGFIYMAEGNAVYSNSDFDAGDSKSYKMELRTDGFIQVFN